MTKITFDDYLDSAFRAFLGERQVPLATMAEVASIHSNDSVPVGVMREAILRSELFQVNGIWVKRK